MNIPRLGRRRGEGKAGCIIGALLLLVGVYIAFKFIPVKVAFADVRDTAVKATEMGSIKKDEDIRREIQMKIKENQPNLDPIKDELIEISRHSDTIAIKFEMHKRIELLGGKYYDYNEKVQESRPLF